MSTQIIYERQVIKTPAGFTLTLLLGDSNVWEDRRKRYRHWYAPLINVPENAVYDYYQRTSGMRFRWNGRELEDDAINRWIKKAMKEALTIEEIAANTRRCVLCYLERYDGSYRKYENWAYVSTTDGFLSWLEEVETKLKNPEPNVIYTRHVGFDGDKPLGLPHVTNNGTGRTIVKCRDAYVRKYERHPDTTSTITMTKDITQAYVFPTREEAVRACSPFRDIMYLEADAALKREANKTYVLCFTSYSPVKYAQKRGKKRWYIVSSIQDAKHYTKQEAERLAERACAAGHVVAAVPLEKEI